MKYKNLYKQKKDWYCSTTVLLCQTQVVMPCQAEYYSQSPWIFSDIFGNTEKQKNLQAIAEN